MGRLILVAALLVACSDQEPEPVAPIEGRTLIAGNEHAEILEYQILFINTQPDGCKTGFGPLVIELQPPNKYKTVTVDCGRVAGGGGDG